MLLKFFLHLRRYRIDVSIRELLDFLAALKARLVFADIARFYYLSRLCLVKDEKYFDRFDRAFQAFFDGLDRREGLFDEPTNIELLRSSLADIYPSLSEIELRHLLTNYQKAVAQLRVANSAGNVSQRQSRDDQHERQEQCSAEAGDGHDKERMEYGEDDELTPGKDDAQDKKKEQGEPKSGEAGEGESGEGEHGSGENGEGNDGENGQGEDGQEGEGENGDRGEGSGDHPGEGIRTELDSVSQRSALKVWEQRRFEDYDPEVELGTRNIKMALRRLRKFARTAADVELDLDDTIRATAHNGGILDIKEVRERRNSVKVLLLLDVGGSMDDHVELCAQLFAAAKSEFKYLEYFYFHNFIYESVWTDNSRRHEVRIALLDLLRKYGRDYKVIFVGDAQMGRHEIAERGGSVEHYNQETGQYWMQQVCDQFRKVIWLNPVPAHEWVNSYSIEMIRRLMDDKMYHLSVDGIESAMKYLVR